MALSLLAAFPRSTTAQDPGRAAAARLAEGWALLAKGDPAGAALVASRELAQDSRNAAALVLAVDAELARGGSTGGLGAYEKWLGSRRLEDGYVLRRVARTLLVEHTGKHPEVNARLAALQALAADGDAAAAATLEEAALAKGYGERTALASIGNERAVKLLIAELNSTPGSKARIIEALAASGSKLAVPPLKALLADPNDLNRAAAAEALGRLEATDAITQIRPLLNDPVFTVKLKAAGALVRLNDSSGLPFLLQLTSSEHGGIRIAAAKELEPQADAAWQALVRSLTNDPDPLVRLEAARLIAPYDHQLAKDVTEALMRDANIGIREAASGVLVERIAADFATLRALMRSADAIVRVRAAGRILELTR